MPKRKRKGGRPRIPAKRNDNGRLSQSKVAIHQRAKETARQAREVALASRMKHREPKVREAAGDPLAGYELGRLFLAGRIGEPLLKAGNRFAEDMLRHYRLTGIPFPSPRGIDIAGVNGRSLAEVDPKKVIASRKRVAGLEGCIGIFDMPGRPIWTELLNLCVRDMGMTSLPHVHKGLRALAEFYGEHAQDVDSRNRAA